MSEISKLAAALVRANVSLRAVPPGANDDAMDAAIGVEARALAQLAAEPATNAEEQREKARAILNCGPDLDEGHLPALLSLLRDVAA